MYTGDFRIVALEADGALVFEDMTTGERYTSGETLTEFGIQNITLDERRALLDDANCSVADRRLLQIDE